MTSCAPQTNKLTNSKKNNGPPVSSGYPFCTASYSTQLAQNNVARYKNCPFGVGTMIDLKNINYVRQ